MQAFQITPIFVVQKRKIVLVLKKNMKAIKTTYIVIIENEECRIPLVYSDVTFSQALKKAKFACPSGYFIREIRVA